MDIYGDIPMMQMVGYKNNIMKSNPILKTLKENDIVFMQVGTILQICRIYDLEYDPKESKHIKDWLEFKGEVLYTNHKLHESMLHTPSGNCMSIIEVISPSHLQQYARSKDLWLAKEYLMSDDELQYQRDMVDDRMKAHGIIS